MNQRSPSGFDFSGWGRAALRSAASWWGVIHFGAIAMVMALSPSTYSRANQIGRAHV